MQSPKELPLNVLRQMWAKAWGKKPADRLGRTFLEASLAFKLSSNVTPELQSRLEQLVKAKALRTSFASLM